MWRRLIKPGVRAGALLIAVTVVLASVLMPAAAMAAPAESTIASAPTSGGCVTYHHVQRGDNLTKISYWYGVSVWAIAQANGLRNPSFIYVGQVLCIPSSYYPPSPHPPQPWPPQPIPPQPVPPSYCGQCYIVQPGDTLSGIARRCGTTVNSLMYLNGIYNPNYIRAGQALRIY